MAGQCMHQTHRGAATAPVNRQQQRQLTLSLSRPPRLAVQSRRTQRRNLPQRHLTLAKAASTDKSTRPPSDVVNSAEDLVQGVQDWIDEASTTFSSDQAPLPEHPIGEATKLRITDELEADVRHLLRTLAAAAYFGVSPGICKNNASTEASHMLF